MKRIGICIGITTLLTLVVAGSFLLQTQEESVDIQESSEVSQASVSTSFDYEEDIPDTRALVYDVRPKVFEIFTAHMISEYPATGGVLSYPTLTSALLLVDGRMNYIEAMLEKEKKSAQKLNQLYVEMDDAPFSLEHVIDYQDHIIRHEYRYAQYVEDYRMLESALKKYTPYGTENMCQIQSTFYGDAYTLCEALHIVYGNMALLSDEMEIVMGHYNSFLGDTETSE